MNTVERALHIGERVRAAYLGEGARRFWPEQFADDLGSEGEVPEDEVQPAGQTNDLAHALTAYKGLVPSHRFLGPA